MIIPDSGCPLPYQNFSRLSPDIDQSMIFGFHIDWEKTEPVKLHNTLGFTPGIINVNEIE
jgi:hypothetical protein